MPADLVHDPVLGQRYRFSREGDVLVVEAWADPGSVIPQHFHPRLEERWHVLEGQVAFSVDGERRPAGPGDRVVAAAGVRHAFENTGDEVALLRVEAEPALDLQQFLEDAAALGRAGLYTRRGLPKGWGALLAGAAFTQHYRDTTVLTFPPPIVQRTLFAPLARLAARRGRTTT
jgi:mannose-6-phosphate isomerase-like protein (cupin superfamily)